MLNATPLLKIYARWRASKLARQDKTLTQWKQLSALLATAQDTIFGRQHNFSSIKNVSDYQKAVPLRSYEQFWKEFFEPHFPVLEYITWPGRVPFFAVSSGTSSGTTKYIPYTHEMTDSNTRAGTDLLVHHVLNRPTSSIFGGRCFMLGGSTELVEQSAGILSGDLSGIAVNTMRWWARQRYFPPPELALLKNWEEKIDRLARESLTADIRMISGVPSWMLIFFKKLFELVPSSQGDLGKIYPKLELLVHGGVNFGPYFPQFTELLKGTRAEMREVYPASEGFIAVADRGYGEGLRLVLDHKIFFEFVPVEELQSSNPTRHWIDTIEKDVNYAIVLSTCAGLWSYVLGDTVRFVECDPPRLLITGRISYYLSAFGEHLIDEEIEDAVSTAARMINSNVVDYSVGPVYPSDPSELGGHLYFVEFSSRIPSDSELGTFSQALDTQLCTRNEDYEAHRAKGFGLKAPHVVAVPPGAFTAWMKTRGKLGGQHKVPRIIMKEDLFEDLSKFMVSFDSERSG